MRIEAGRAQLTAQVPMPLNGPLPPESAAEPLTWLASEANPYLCRQVIFIDGGYDALTPRETRLVTSGADCDLGI